MGREQWSSPTLALVLPSPVELRVLQGCTHPSTGTPAVVQSRPSHKLVLAGKGHWSPTQAVGLVPQHQAHRKRGGLQLERFRLDRGWNRVELSSSSEEVYFLGAPSPNLTFYFPRVDLEAPEGLWKPGGAPAWANLGRQLADRLELGLPQTWGAGLRARLGGDVRGGAGPDWRAGRGRRRGRTRAPRGGGGGGAGSWSRVCESQWRWRQQVPETSGAGDSPAADTPGPPVAEQRMERERRRSPG